MQGVEERKIWRYESGNIVPRTDIVVTEVPLTVQLNNEELATLLSSPHERKEMVVGFLANEGFISKKSDIQKLLIDEREGIAWVETADKENKVGNLFLKRYITSCCGRARPNFYFANDALTAKRVTSSFAMSGKKIVELMGCIETEMFTKTGGVHGGGICDAQEALHVTYDTGRHNVVDKLYGWGIMTDIGFEDKCLMFSGRTSSEILLKASKMGIPILASRSAPMGLAIDLAEELGVTLLGFIRNGKMNIYTHPERILR